MGYYSMNRPSAYGGPGIPSTILGALGIILFLIAVLLGSVFAYTKTLSSFTYSLIGILVLIDIFVLVWGLILGIKGFYRKEYKTFFSIVGLILNSLMLFFIIGSIVRYLVVKYV